MGAPIAYVDMASQDAGRLGSFYAGLFDWKLAPSEGDASYSMIDTGHEVAGGVGPTQGPDAPAGITVYVKVDDLQAYLDKAEKLGGTIVMTPMELPGGFGSIALFADPDGNAFGLWG